MVRRVSLTLVAALLAVALVLPADPAFASNGRACRLVDRAWRLDRGSVTAYSVEIDAFYAATSISLQANIERAMNANMALNAAAETRYLRRSRNICNNLGY